MAIFSEAGLELLAPGARSCWDGEGGAAPQADRCDERGFVKESRNDRSWYECTSSLTLGEELCPF